MSLLTQNCHNARYAGLMIISERTLFKGLASEPDTTRQDRLFDRGHAFAVSIVVSVSLVALVGVLSLLG